jgi:hypothetical protein
MQTEKMIRIAFALTLTLAACGSAPSHGGATGGESGGDTGGDTGSGTGGSGTGGSKTTGTTTGGSTGTGGATATGGDTGTGGSMTASPDASAGGESGSGGDDAGPPSTGGSGGGGVSAGHTGALGWYEAEAAMLFGGSKIGNCGAPACMSTQTIKEGDECCSAGKKVSQLLRGRGGVTFNGVMAPSEGMYDVTWWYHCGKSDNFGDTTCGGAPHTPSGCRPHVFTINGTAFPKVYHFPCYPGDWGQIHASTVTMPLKAGMNSISVHATPGRDAADLDAIEVFPSGKGFPPNVAGTNN